MGSVCRVALAALAMELVKGMPGVEMGIGMVTGRRNSTDSDYSFSAAEADRSLGPKLLEKRRQKKRRDTAVRYFRTHRGLYETQEDRSLRTEITCAPTGSHATPS